jgi:hypothetical protein
VGLGGTGQWVLTWLKRDLMLANNGKVPDNIRLLSIDTATMLEAGQTRVTADQREEKAAEVGGVALDSAEFVYIGGDSRPLAQEVLREKHPQLRRWYRAKFWLDTQPPAVFVLDNGAGRIRQFGRMAIFKDIMGGDASRRLWNTFRYALQSVGKMTDDKHRLEVIVVGSFAGGTGSGMFLDTALILRKLAKDVSPHHVLRGFFALPGVFTPNPSRDMKARTFAAWRELNRFMVIDSDFPMAAITYSERDNTYKVEPEDRIFDACYLVEGRRGETQLATEARFGVFPMISEVISAILDEKAGQVYSDWVYTNLAEVYGKNTSTPMYSAIGAYTVQVPANYIEVISSHSFGQQMLLRLLGPEIAPDKESKRLMAEGALRHLTLAGKASNLEDKGFAGRERSSTFMTADSVYEGQIGRPSIFMAREDTLLREARERGMQPQVIERLARAGTMGGGGAEGWIRFYPEFGDDPQFAELLKKVHEHTRLNLVAAFGRRDKEKAEDFQKRIIQLDPLVREKFGASRIGGDEMVEYDGSFGDVLREVHDTQLIIFRQMLRLRLLALLMGRDANPLIARSGKLGYTWDYFDGVVSDLDWFLKNVMDGVAKRRSELRPTIDAEIRNRKAEDYLIKVKDKRFLGFWESPAVKKAETLYLRTEQEKMDIRREDILHRYVVGTLRAMKAAAEQVRDAVQSWIWHLSTGDAASSLPGLWNNLLDSESKVIEAHGWDKSAGNVQRLVAEVTLPVTDEDLAKTLSRWQWTASFSGDHLNLGVNLLPEIESHDPIELTNPAAEDSLKQRAELGQSNSARLLGLARRAYAGRVDDTRVADVIIQEYGRNGGAAFANNVARTRAEPLFVGATTSTPKRRSNLIRVMAPTNDTFFAGPQSVESELRRLEQLPEDKVTEEYGIQVVGSENPFKLTLVRSDDLYDYDEFKAWEECQQAYADHMNDSEGLMQPVNLHNFAAEANAVRIEQRLVNEDSREYRPLHPRVVVLLENPEPVSQFYYLHILEKIREVDTRADHHWELEWERKSGPETIYLTKPWKVDDAGDSQKPDIINAIHGYAIRQLTYQPGSARAVDVDFARHYLEKEMKDAGNEAVCDVLREELNGTEGLIGQLESLARDSDNPNIIVRPDLNDLALVFRTMARDELERRQEAMKPPTINRFEAARLKREAEAARAAEEAQAND